MTPHSQRCLDYIVSVKTKEPIDGDIADKVRREINIGIWKTLDDVLPREINLIVDSSLHSDATEWEKVLDELKDFLQKLPEPASIDGIEMWNKVFKKIKELRSSKPEEKPEFNDYRDMNNPNGHPDKLRQSKQEEQG